MSNDSGTPKTPLKFFTGEEFRKYLERGGVIDSLTRVLAALYEEPEWPINPNEYLCMKLSEMCQIPIIEKLKYDVQILQERNKSLERTVNTLNIELNHRKFGSSDSDGLRSQFASSVDISASSLP